MKRRENKSSTLGRLMPYVKAHGGLLTLAILTAIISSGLTLVGPRLIGNAIDYIVGVGNVDFPYVMKICAILLVLYAGASLLQWVVSICSNALAYRVAGHMRTRAFENLAQLPLSYHDTHANGDLMSRLTNDIDAVADGLQQSIMQLLTGIVTIVGTFGFMLSLSVQITLAVLVITPVAIVIARFITKHSSSMFQKQSKTVGELNAITEEYITGSQEVQVFAHEKAAQAEFEEVNERLYQCGQKAQFYSSLVNPTTRVVNNTAYIAVGIAGSLLALTRGFTIGNISGFLSYATQFAKPINEISSVSTQVQAALASAERVLQLIDEKPEPAEPTNMPTLENISGKVDFSQVSFSYRTDVPLIKNLNLHAQPGQLIAIVGPTGAGKTTLVNLLMRFYETDRGSILVDDTDIHTVTRDSLRTSFAMVLQDTWLFQGTIRENIKYGNPDATDEQMLAASKAARAHGFIKRLPFGYDAVLEENGDNLSLGQKQLLTIARALLINPPMLILDEATSSVDTRTEIAVQKAFNDAMNGRTSFVIAHRLSTIRDADCILVMQDGSIVEQGTHDQLLQTGGLYAQLYQSQFAPT